MAHLRTVVALLLAVVALCIAAPAPGQDDALRVELTAEQLDLNDGGVTSLIEKDYDEAIKRFQTSLAIGAANITYLNLGRAFALSGDCVHAVESYDQVATAPHVPDPPPHELYAILERYRRELAQQCEGTLTLFCAPADMSVRIDDDEPFPCRAEPLALGSGEHRVEGRVGALAVSQTTTVVGLQDTPLRLTIEVPPETVKVEPPEGLPEPEPLFTLQEWGLMLGGTGGIALLVALSVELWVIAPDVDAYEAAARRGDRAQYRDLQGAVDTEQLVNRILVGVGATGLVVGGTLLLLDFLGEEEPSPQLGFVPVEGGGSVRLWLTW